MENSSDLLSSNTPIITRLGCSSLYKSYGNVKACDGVDISITPSSIHAIVGQNGAGKSTLMKIFQGLEQPESGKIIINDQPVSLKTPSVAMTHGIGMVHQEFMLVPEFSLLENLILGNEPITSKALGLGAVNFENALTDAQKLSEFLDINLDWETPTIKAPVHVRQILEILKLLYKDVDVLILDEPTAVLAPSQVDDLFKLLRKINNNGKTIVFISHKLNEVVELAHKISVLRKGKMVYESQNNELEVNELAKRIIGAEMEPVIKASSNIQIKSLYPRLKVSNVSAKNNKETQALQEIDLEILAGEVLGVAAVAGNGQEELIDCLAGLRKIETGSIQLDGEEISGFSVSERRNKGIGYISPDRAHEGLCLETSLKENILAGQHKIHQLAPLGIINNRKANAVVEKRLQEFEIVHESMNQKAKDLSGGNQQKLVISRELSAQPKMMIISQPTRGVDISGRNFIHQKILDYSNNGGAVILASEELDELLFLSTKIAVVYRGMVMGIKDSSEIDIDQIGKMMLGVNS